MQNPIIIAGQPVQEIEYRNQTVVTFKMIDSLHQRPEGTAKRNFNQNKRHFIPEKDYFEVPYSEWKEILKVRISYLQVDSENHGGARSAIFFFTLHGYLMLVKPFNDDLAWQVQRQLIDGYFINLEKYQRFVEWMKHPYQYLSNIEREDGKFADLHIQMCAYNVEFDDKYYFILSDYADEEVAIPKKAFSNKHSLTLAVFKNFQIVLKLPTKSYEFAEMVNVFHDKAEEGIRVIKTTKHGVKICETKRWDSA